MFKEFLAKLVEGADLSAEEAELAMADIISGKATPAQVAGFLTALRMKGETPAEIVGCARAMRLRANRIRARRSPLVDTCGTGGDRSGSFNISTTAAFVVAGAGVAVAKHGNRSVSSSSGSADVLEALGINVGLEPREVEDCIEEVGMGFLFAPTFHPAMKHAAGPRKEMGFRTVFNMLGPLTNPAGAEVQLVGVYDPALTEVVAQALRELGASRALVVCSTDGMDEISPCAPTRVTELRGGAIATSYMAPEDLGVRPCDPAGLRGGSPERNAQIAGRVLEGDETGAARKAVLLNAGAALYIAGKARDWKEGLRMAAESIDSGTAMSVLERLRQRTRRCGKGARGDHPA